MNTTKDQLERKLIWEECDFDHGIDGHDAIDVVLHIRNQREMVETWMMESTKSSGRVVKLEDEVDRLKEELISIRMEVANAD